MYPQPVAAVGERAALGLDEARKGGGSKGEEDPVDGVADRRGGGGGGWGGAAARRRCRVDRCRRRGRVGGAGGGRHGARGQGAAATAGGGGTTGDNTGHEGFRRGGANEVKRQVPVGEVGALRPRRAQRAGHRARDERLCAHVGAKGKVIDEAVGGHDGGGTIDSLRFDDSRGAGCRRGSHAGRGRGVEVASGRQRDGGTRSGNAANGSAQETVG